MDRKLIHICEVCGKTEMLTPAEAFSDGWDYPPRMGGFGIVGPRTCGDCYNLPSRHLNNTFTKPPEPHVKLGISGQKGVKNYYDKSIIHLPRQRS